MNLNQKEIKQEPTTEATLFQFYSSMGYCNQLYSHITLHFHAFLKSYANILTSYTPLTVAKTSLSNCLLFLTDVALIF